VLAPAPVTVDTWFGLATSLHRKWALCASIGAGAARKRGRVASAKLQLCVRLMIITQHLAGMHHQQRRIWRATWLWVGVGCAFLSSGAGAPEDDQSQQHGAVVFASMDTSGGWFHSLALLRDVACILKQVGRTHARSPESFHTPTHSHTSSWEWSPDVYAIS
jgi:hypothetical protein